MANAIRSMWQQIGIQVEIETVEDGRVFSRRLKRNEYDFAIASWYADYPDPMTFYGLLSSDSSKNHSDWRSKEFDSAIDQALVSTNTTNQNLEYVKMESLLNTYYPIVPIVHTSRVFVLSDRLLKLRETRRFPLSPWLWR